MSILETRTYFDSFDHNWIELKNTKREWWDQRDYIYLKTQGHVMFLTTSVLLEDTKLFLILFRCEPLIWDALFGDQVERHQVLCVIYPQCVKITLWNILSGTAFLPWQREMNEASFPLVSTYWVFSVSKVLRTFKKQTSLISWIVYFKQIKHINFDLFYPLQEGSLNYHLKKNVLTESPLQG